ncbi:MAG: CoxG family protein [Paracoccaceae bacterium]
MELTGERMIAAPRSDVWTALNDPDVLKECIPGCQEMVRGEDGSFAATVKQKIGPVSATFKGAVRLEDVVEGESYRLVGEGKGGAAGFAKGAAAVKLEDADIEGVPGTKLAYDAEAKVGGKLAQLGSRLVDGVARQVADQFFDAFKARLEGPAEPAGEGAAPTDAEPSAETPAEDPSAPDGTPERKGWFNRIIGS